jgi:site-specific DNA-methyltransferase (adenine-specific)
MELLLGNCLDRLKDLEDNSIDAIVTDPPYGLSFMGKKWDYDVPSVDIWKECLRVLKPGGHLLSFAGTRTQHRMAVNIEDAGFEIRDMIAWVYGSGFPKSLNIGKVMDKYLKTGNASWNGTGDSSNGALGYSKLQHNQGYRPADYSNKHQNKEEITEDLAKKWEGWGTALKPALEPITVARKPLGEKTVAENCLKWGVGGINIDGCRVGFDMSNKEDVHAVDQWARQSKSGVKVFNQEGSAKLQEFNQKAPTGRFPANLIHDGSDEVVGLFPQTKPSKPRYDNREKQVLANTNFVHGSGSELSDSGGSASRFFYCAKASKKERNIGCEGLEKRAGGSNAKGYTQDVARGLDRNRPVANFHPTVKPLALMEYLVKLVSREGQVVLDPFMGSGTTGMACKRLGREFIGIEIDEEYFKIAQARIDAWKADEQLKLVEH